MDRGEEKDGKRIERYVDEVITHNYDHEAKNAVFELAPESAPNKRPTTTPYNGHMVVPSIIITPPPTTQVAPKDTEPVTPATTSSLHEGKVYLKPDVLYPPTSIECADAFLGYPRRTDSRSVLSAACGETLAW